jgi:hypothetical protein
MGGIAMPDEVKNTDWRDFVFVLTAGGVGGLFSSLYDIFEKKGVESICVYLVTIPVGCILGALAALVGVYLIANTDRKALPRCVVFALMCGFVWQPVIQAGRSLITNQMTSKDAEASKLAESAATDAGKLQGTASEVLPEKIKESAATIRDAIKAGAKVDNPAVKKEVAAKTEEAVKDINKAALQAPSLPEATKKMVEQLEGAQEVLR